MLIRDIALLLQSEGIGTLGADIFLAYRPDEPDDVIAIYDTGGFPAEPELPDLRRTVQISVRGKSYAATYSRIWQMYRLLDRPEERLITANGRKMIARAMQPPTLLDRDASNRVLFVFNLQAWTGRD